MFREQRLCRNILRHMLFVMALTISMVHIINVAHATDQEPAVEDTDTKDNPKEPYSLGYVGDLSTHTAAYEDTLVNVSRGYGLGFVELRAANPEIDPWLPGEGTKIKLPTRHLIPDAPRDGIIINLPEMRLYSFVNTGEPPLTFPIGVGRVGLDTPLGQTTVISKTVAPKWRPTKRMREEDPELPAVVGPGPQNPLGTHALYLGWPEYAIHGTNKPYGIGRRVSSGCVRMYPENIKEFYYATPVGTKVTVVNQPIKAAWINDELYLEAHATLTQADRVEKLGGYPSYEVTEADMQLINKIAGDHKDKLNWLQIRKVIRERSGVPLLIATRPATAVTTHETAKKQDKAHINTLEDEITPEEKLSDSEHTMPADETVTKDNKTEKEGAADTKKPARKRPVFKHNS